MILELPQAFQQRCFPPIHPLHQENELSSRATIASEEQSPQVFTEELQPTRFRDEDASFTASRLHAKARKVRARCGCSLSRCPHSPFDCPGVALWDGQALPAAKLPPDEWPQAPRCPNVAELHCDDLLASNSWRPVPTRHAPPQAHLVRRAQAQHEAPTGAHSLRPPNRATESRHRIASRSHPRACSDLRLSF